MHSTGDEIKIFFPDESQSILVPTKRMEEAWFTGSMNDKFIQPKEYLLKEAKERVDKVFRKDG